MTARRCVLHIGPMKTGTTTVQDWLAHNRAALAAEGVHFPLAALGTNHPPLALAFEGGPDGAALDRLHADLDALPPSIHTVVLSGELMGQRLNAPEMVRPLVAFLRPWFGAVTIVAYLRRQDELGVSMHSTALKRGEATPLLWGPMNFRPFLGAWATVVGRDAMRVRIFDRAEMVGGDVVADFLHAAGLPGDPKRRRAERNPSLAPAAQRALALLREALGDARLADLPLRQALVAELERRFPGPGALPTRAEVEAWYARCRPWNEEVRRAWFPERDTLFREDFGRYPAEPQPPPSDAAVLEAALAGLAAVLRARA